jgi:hypothetical protein
MRKVGYPARVIRKILLMAGFAILCAAVLLLWRHRFERIPGQAGFSLVDLVPCAEHGETAVRDPRTGAILMRHAASGPAQVALFDFPAMEDAGHLHIRLRATARDLTPGSADWEDGRTFIEWHDPQGLLPPDPQSIHSARYDTVVRRDRNAMVIRAAHPGAVPRLRVEHLGISGFYQIDSLDVLPVRPSAVWKYGRWPVLAGWLLWVMALVRKNKKPAWWRGFLTAVVCVVMATRFIVPGPWEIIRPLAVDFSLGAEQARSPAAADDINTSGMPFPVLRSPAEPLGKMPVSGNLILKIKHYLSMIRPVLHGLLLFAPAFTIAWLAGWRVALMLSAMIAAGIEIAQCLFGYGFDLLDVSDLIFDACGIALGLWVYSRFSARIHRCLPRHFPEPA